MRHCIKGKKLNRNTAHRSALLENLTIALVTHGTICTTLHKAKFMRSYVEKAVTLAKKGTLSSKRSLISALGDRSAVDKLINDISKQYADRHGGYVRIVKSGYRKGDMAPMAYIQFV